VPIIVKKRATASPGRLPERLTAAGVDALDVAGKGGTTWSGSKPIAQQPRTRRGRNKSAPCSGNGAFQPLQARSSVLPNTTASLQWWCPTGLDVAKRLPWVPAPAVGETIPETSQDGPDAVIERVGDLIAELRTAMFVTGSGSIDELQQVEYVLHGRASTWNNEPSSE